MTGSLSMVQKKEIENAYKSLFMISLSTGIFSLIITNSLQSFNIPWFELDIIGRICPYMFLSVSSLLYLFKHNSLVFRRSIILVTAEMMSWCLKIRDEHYQNPVFALIASFLLVNFQLKLVNSLSTALFLSVKHIIIWVIFKEYISDDLLSLVPHLVQIYACCAHMLINYYYNAENKKELSEYASKLEWSNGQMNMLLEALPEGLIVLGENLITLKSNESLKNILGNESIEDLVYTRKMQDSQSDSVITDIQRSFSLPLSTQQVLGSVYCNEKYIEITVRKINWDHLEAVMVIFKDISSSVRLEVIETEQACQVQMLRFLSHELKTPTNSIINTLDSLPVRSYELETINTSANLLLLLIGDIVDYSKLQTGDFSLNKSNEDIRDMVYKTTQLIQIQTSYNKIDLIVRIDPCIPTEGTTDKQRFAQLLLILLSNALKFTNKGRIEVIVLLKSPQTLKVIVTDTGIGIPKERLQMLREGFMNGCVKGINKIGLDLCNMIARALGGKGLRIQSKPFKGTSVSFYVNISEKPCSVGKFVPFVPASQSGFRYINDLPSIQKKKDIPQLLIVDDEPLNRLVLRGVMEKYRIPFAEACNGEEAVEIVAQKDRIGMPFKVIIMDLLMQPMNGWEASQTIFELVQDKIIAEAPCIIAYSAISSNEDIKRCYESGMVFYLPKPSPPTDIIRAIEKFMPIR